MIGQPMKFDRIELWFEHDLYDQLQLLQILDVFAGEDLPKRQIAPVQADEYLGACRHRTTIMRFDAIVMGPVSD